MARFKSESDEKSKTSWEVFVSYIRHFRREYLSLESILLCFAVILVGISLFALFAYLKG